MTLKNIKPQGFTIVELLIVIVVIAILAAITIVAYNGVQNRAKTTSAQSLANNIVKKAEVYNQINSSYPTNAELVNNYAPGATVAGGGGAEAKLDDASKVQTAVPTDETKVAYNKCTTGAQVIWFNKSANKAIAVGVGGQASTAADGSGTAATVCS